VISREVASQFVFMRMVRTLVGLLVFALIQGFPATEIGLTSTAHAQEEKSPEQTEEDAEAPADESEAGDEGESGDAEAPNDSDEDEPAEEPAETEAEAEPPADKPKAEESANDKKEKAEQEAAEDAVGEEVSEAEQAADEEEEAKASAEEAAGAEVEIDESDEDEEEPKDSQESPNRPKEEVTRKPPKDAPPIQKRVIGATATIMEKQSELLFRARVDSGAKSCSLHIEDYKIENESDTMAENIGKVVTFHIKNGNGESHWLSAKIAGYVIVKNAAHRERRYKVPMTFRYKDFEKTVLVTLNNREKMEYPLL
jgi:hypothetical protein